MIQIQNKPFDFHLWTNINRKYIMCYKTPYSMIEEEFIKDLFSIDRFNIYVDGQIIKDYQHYINCVNNNIIDKTNNNKLKRIFKSIYTWEIWKTNYSIGKLLDEAYKYEEIE